MFTPLQYDGGKNTVIKNGTASSTTITKGDALDWSSGYLQRATSGTTEVRYVAAEDVTTAAAAHTDIEVIPTFGVRFECDTNGSTSVAIRGTYIDLTDHATLNEAASSTDVFYVEDYKGATTDKKVVGYFVHNIS